MAVELSYDDLMKDVEKKIEEKGLYFTAKDGKKVTLRPLMLLRDEELKTARVLLKEFEKENAKGEDEEQDLFKLAEITDKLLICTADQKKSLSDSLKELPFESRMDILTAWMGADDEAGEASSSES